MLVGLNGFCFVQFQSCKHEPEKVIGSSQMNPVNPVTNDSICFNTQVQPLISSNCAKSGCHDDITKADGVSLTTYSKIRNQVTPYNTNNSKLLKQILETGKDRMPPAPSAPLDAASIELLTKWISQGALDRSCTASVCDTNNVKLSTHIQPLIDLYCKGCHTGAAAGGGVLLDSYSAIKASANTGKLMCALQWTGSCSNMPKGSAKLSFCNIRKFELWIQAGANND